MPWSMRIMAAITKGAPIALGKITSRAIGSGPIYPGFLAVTFQELESIMTPFGP
jgi:hypothetical protein